jgi:hypothetical protein
MTMASKNKDKSKKAQKAGAVRNLAARKTKAVKGGKSGQAGPKPYQAWF